jgi:hypothetical protein
MTNSPQKVIQIPLTRPSTAREWPTAHLSSKNTHRQMRAQLLERAAVSLGGGSDFEDFLQLRYMPVKL